MSQVARAREAEKTGGGQPLVLQVPAIRKPTLMKNHQPYELQGRGGEQAWEQQGQPKRVRVEDARRDYDQRGTTLSRVVVNTANATKNRDAASVADDVAARLEVEVEKIVEIIQHENVLTIGLATEMTKGLEARVKLLVGVHLAGGTGRVHRAQLQGMQSIRDRDAKERVVRIYGGAMSTEVGKEDRRYLRAVERKAGKELFERDEENEIILYVENNTETSYHGIAKMEY